MIFKVATLIEIDADANLLPVDEEMHEQAVKEKISDLLFELDEVKLKGMKVVRED